MLFITGLILFVAIVLVVADWRRAFFVAVPVAILQDPLRKLTPGEPVLYVVLVGVVIAAAVLVATARGVSVMPNRIRGWGRYMALPFGLFIIVVVLQALNAYSNFGSFIIPAIGALAYLTPFIGLAIAYQSILRSPPNYLTQFLQLYVLLATLALGTIYLQYVGYDWPILGEVGSGLIIYDMGTALRAYSGVFRSSEIAAWHAATAICFVGILLLSKPMTLGRVAWSVALILVLVGLAMMTGRRKTIIQVAIFIVSYGALLLYFGRGASRLAIALAFAGLVAFLGFTMVAPGGTEDLVGRDIPYEYYVERTKTAFGDVPDRIATLGIAPISWAYNRYGLLGAGLGAGSQGTQHFGAISQGAAEGGLGKIWLELGAPGLIVVALLGIALARYLWLALSTISRQSAQLSHISFGLASFLIANVATFSIATQVYGDVFVLLVLGLALSAILAMPVLAERVYHQRVSDAVRYPVNATVPMNR